MAAFVKEFQYDIFLSYAHANDQPEREGERGWVAKFHNNLLDKLAELIGRRENFAVFCDPKIRGLDDQDVKIEAALRSSALLVMVLSPAWLASTYCAQELDLFWDACVQGTGSLVGEGCRAVKVGYDHVLSENHPEKVRGTGVCSTASRGTFTRCSCKWRRSRRSRCCPRMRRQFSWRK